MSDKKRMVEAISLLMETNYIEKEDILLFLERKLEIDDMREIAVRKYYGSDIEINKKRIIRDNL